MTTSSISASIERMDHNSTISLPTKIWRFLLHFLEMQVPMVLGMVLFGVLVRPLRLTSYGAAFRSGADLFILGDALFMSLPMVAWMIFRGHGWRHSLEMAASMIVPGIAIIVLGWLGIDPYLPWLAKAACGVMCLGMFIYMLFRFSHFTGEAGHSEHTAHVDGTSEAICH